MTIGDLEQQAGMTRANIRYYEQEGLLFPSRRENGYRDYSQEDLATLLRIKLLRQLDFSLEEIRQLQRGELDFSAAMARRGDQLARESQAMANARQVCLDLGREVRSFQELHADEYLGRLSGVQTVPTADTPEFHPWRRYFARGMDFGLAALVVLFVKTVFLHNTFQEGLSSDFGQTLLTWLIVLLIEPLLIHFWGTTPGKWVWGIQVEQNGGGMLTLSEAYKRTFLVFAAGEGLSIPILNLVCNFFSYRQYTRGETLYWERDSAIRFRERGWFSPAVFIGSIVLRFGLAVCAVLLSLLPPCRGELSVAAFAENFNFYRTLGEGNSDGFYLDDTGTWQRTYVDNMLSLEQPSHPKFLIETTDGLVQSVSYTLELPQQAEIVTLTNTYAQAAYLALAAAQPETDLWNVQAFFRTTRGWNAAKPFSCQWENIAMDYIVDLDGFGVMSNYGTDDSALLFPDDEGRAPNHLSVAFRVARDS